MKTIRNKVDGVYSCVPLAGLHCANQPMKCEATGTDIKHARLQTGYANEKTFLLMF